MTGVAEQEDMISWSLLGLLDAIETYDPEGQVRVVRDLSKIRWAILDGLRSQD